CQRSGDLQKIVRPPVSTHCNPREAPEQPESQECPTGVAATQDDAASDTLGAQTRADEAPESTGKRRDQPPMNRPLPTPERDEQGREQPPRQQQQASDR